MELDAHEGNTPNFKKQSNSSRRAFASNNSGFFPGISSVCIKIEMFLLNETRVGPLVYTMQGRA